MRPSLSRLLRIERALAGQSGKSTPTDPVLAALERLSRQPEHKDTIDRFVGLSAEIRASGGMEKLSRDYSRETQLLTIQFIRAAQAVRLAMEGV